MQAFDHLGDYTKNPAFSSFHNLSVRAFALYHEGINEADLSRPLTDLVRRMMYIAEGSIVGLQLTASWALTHPPFSLCWDRFEQCVRLSWLARQSNSREWYRYIADYYLTRNRLKNAFQQTGIEPAVIDAMPDLDPAPQNKPVRRRRRSKAGAVELEVDGITVKIARGADAGTISAMITALRETR